MCDMRKATGETTVDGESWRAGLPVKFRRDIRVPVQFEVFEDEGSGARRIVGYDADGCPCFARATAAIERLASEDDEDYYLVPSLIVRRDCWRLADGRWLGVERENAAPGACKTVATRCSITPTQPR
jgi:hypothetical protein